MMTPTKNIGKLLRDYLREEELALYRADRLSEIRNNRDGDLNAFTVIETSSCGHYATTHHIPQLELMAWIYTRE